MCRLPLNCSFLKIHPWWLVWHSFLKPLLFLDLHREINLQWQTDMLNTNLKFNWNYFMPLWSIVIHYFVLPWLQHREEGGWVFPFSGWATWEDKLGEATQENLTIIFCPLAMHVAPSQELTPWPSVIEVCSLCQDMLWVGFSQRVMLWLAASQGFILLWL